MKTNSLIWTESAGIQKSRAHGFEYRVGHVISGAQGDGYRIIIEWEDGNNDPWVKDETCKALKTAIGICESHHRAVAKAVAEAS